MRASCCVVVLPGGSAIPAPRGCVFLLSPDSPKQLAVSRGASCHMHAVPWSQRGVWETFPFAWKGRLVLQKSQV